MSNNSQNISEIHLTIQLETLILLTSIWTVGILIALMSIAIVLISKQKLIRLEFYILMVLCTSSLSFRILVVTDFIFGIVMHELFLLTLNCTYSIINVLALIMILQFSMTMIYYSLFQVSTINRNKFFLNLYTFIHKTRNFLIYEMLVLTLMMVLTFVYVYLAYLDVGECPNIFVIVHKYLTNAFLIQLLVSSAFPVIVYSSAVVYLLYSRFINVPQHSKYTSNEKTRFRNSIILLVKFLLLILIFISSSLTLSGFYFLSFLYPNSTAYYICGYLGSTLFVIFPIGLIYIHSILCQTLKQLLCFNFNYR